MPVLSKGDGPSDPTPTTADAPELTPTTSARAGARPFRSQAARVGRAARWRLIRQLGWLLLAAPMLLLIVSDGVVEQTTPAGAATC